MREARDKESLSGSFSNDLSWSEPDSRDSANSIEVRLVSGGR